MATVYSYLSVGRRGIKNKFMHSHKLNERVSASAVDWSGDEAAMSLIGSPTDGSFIVTHTPDGSNTSVNILT